MADENVLDCADNNRALNKTQLPTWKMGHYVISFFSWPEWGQKGCKSYLDSSYI